MFTFYHGTTPAAAESVANNIEIRAKGFHLTQDIEIARNYGRHIVKFTVDSPFDSHVGLINKDGNHNAVTGNSIEYVLKHHQHLVSFYNAVDDIEIIH